MKGVQLTKLVQELGLHNLTPEIDLAEIWIKTAEIIKRESPATKAQKERLKKLISMHQLVPEYDVEMLTKNEASRQIDRILAAYGSLQK